MKSSRERDIMEGVAELHRRGYGRLKVFCYVKEGLGAWRHWLFASDDFPEHANEVPRPFARGDSSIETEIQGASAPEIADRFPLDHPELAAAAIGVDAAYVEWLAELLDREPNGILEMESANEALLAGRPITPPRW